MTVRVATEIRRDGPVRFYRLSEPMELPFPLDAFGPPGSLVTSSLVGINSIGSIALFSEKYQRMTFWHNVLPVKGYFDVKSDLEKILDKRGYDLLEME